jgi:branched-chain amino acid aminotransferase
MRGITSFELITADEVFVTGTGAEILPVTKIAGRIIGDGKAGKITLKLMEEFEKECKNPANGPYKSKSGGTCLYLLGSI